MNSTHTCISQHLSVESKRENDYRTLELEVSCLPTYFTIIDVGEKLPIHIVTFVLHSRKELQAITPSMTDFGVSRRENAK